MALSFALAVGTLSFLSCSVSGKVYERCQLAKELRDVHEIAEDKIATWVCIAKHESDFNTSAINHGSGDHGIFQISELYWCSPPGEGYACGVACSAFEDDDIEDDVICARRIYRQHQRISGNGFTAWAVYNSFCNNPSKVNEYIKDCTSDDNRIKVGHKSTTTELYTPLKISKKTSVKALSTKAYQQTTARVSTSGFKSWSFTTTSPGSSIKPFLSSTKFPLPSQILKNTDLKVKAKSVEDTTIHARVKTTEKSEYSIFRNPNGFSLVKN